MGITAMIPMEDFLFLEFLTTVSNEEEMVEDALVEPKENAVLTDPVEKDREEDCDEIAFLVV